jgi:hypothetical protein
VQFFTTQVVAARVSGAASANNAAIPAASGLRRWKIRIESATFFIFTLQESRGRDYGNAVAQRIERAKAFCPEEADAGCRSLRPLGFGSLAT